MDVDRYVPFNCPFKYKTFASNINMTNMTNFWLGKIQNVTFLVILKQCESPHFHLD